MWYHEEAGRPRNIGQPSTKYDLRARGNTPFKAQSYSTYAFSQSLYDYILPVDKLANPNLENLHRLHRLDLRFAFTKLALWRQTQFRKIVYVDADVVALRAPDELFSLPTTFAAAPDVGWPDCFNTGVMLLSPNMGEYWALRTLACSGTSFDGADQGLLNQYFANGKRTTISFGYNCTPSASYQYEPAYRHYGSGISMVHFIGREKPWGTGRARMENEGKGVYKELLGRWWAVHDRHYRISASLYGRTHQLVLTFCSNQMDRFKAICGLFSSMSKASIHGSLHNTQHRGVHRLSAQCHQSRIPAQRWMRLTKGRPSRSP